MLSNVVLVSNIHQHESAIGIHTSPPSWTWESLYQLKITFQGYHFVQAFCFLMNWFFKFISFYLQRFSCMWAYQLINFSCVCFCCFLNFIVGLISGFGEYNSRVSLMVSSGLLYRGREGRDRNPREQMSPIRKK